MAVRIAPAGAGCCRPPDSCGENSTPSKPKDKYYHEVGAEMAGNQLIIRMEKDKSKRGINWDPPCDCDVIEIKRPKNVHEKPKIVNGGDNNQILFRIHSKGHLTKKEDPYYRPQAIAYQINKSGTDADDHCRKVTIYPQFGGPVSQEVYSDHITSRKEDVYVLRVKKKNESGDEPNKPRLEVELHTPKLVPKKPPPKPKPIQEKPVEEKPKEPKPECQPKVTLEDRCAEPKKTMMAQQQEEGGKKRCKPKGDKKKSDAEGAKKGRCCGK